MTGPEILISTKTMSSAFGKNLANRFEEAYGDAKNLKGRHPLATLGFFFLLNSSIVDEPRNFSKAITMLQKLRVEDDAYDATCLMLVDWEEDGRLAISPLNEKVPEELSATSFFREIVDLTLLRERPRATNWHGRNGVFCRGVLWNRLVGTCGPERNIARLGDTPRRAFPYYSGRAKLETFLGAALPPPSFQRYPSPPQGGRPIGLAAFCFRPRSLDSHTTIAPVGQENRPLDPLESVLAHADSRMRWARSAPIARTISTRERHRWDRRRSRYGPR